MVSVRFKKAVAAKFARDQQTKKGTRSENTNNKNYQSMVLTFECCVRTKQPPTLRVATPTTHACSKQQHRPHAFVLYELFEGRALPPPQYIAHRIAPHRFALHHIVPHCTASHCTALSFTASHRVVLGRKRQQDIMPAPCRGGNV